MVRQIASCGVLALAVLCASPVVASPGTYFVSGYGSKSSQDSSEAFMLAHEIAVANAERTCSYYANSYQGEDWRLSEVRTVMSNGSWTGNYFFANVSISAKCIVTRS